MNRRLFLSALPAALLAGCGFQLRREGGIPFASLYVDPPSGSAVAQRVLALLKSGKNTQLVATAAEAAAVLKISKEERTKTILSLSGAGRVTEYRLGLNVNYALTVKGDSSPGATEGIELTRDITYDDSVVLAKSAEEGLLYRDMEEDTARRIIRRLRAFKPGADS